MRRVQAAAPAGACLERCLGAFVAEALADGIRLAVEDYRRFMSGTNEDPKDFAARHTAARAALGHFEQARKLLGAESGAGRQAKEGPDLVGEAKAALSLPPSEEEPADGDGAAD